MYRKLAAVLLLSIAADIQNIHPHMEKCSPLCAFRIRALSAQVPDCLLHTCRVMLSLGSKLSSWFKSKSAFRNRKQIHSRMEVTFKTTCDHFSMCCVLWEKRSYKKSNFVPFHNTPHKHQRKTAEMFQIYILQGFEAQNSVFKAAHQGVSAQSRCF